MRSDVYDRTQIATQLRVEPPVPIGVERAFLLGTALAAVGILVSLFLPEIPLRGTIQDHPTG